MQKLREMLEEKFQGDFSENVVERICEVIDEFLDSQEVDFCPNCEKRFLTSENALQYEDSNGDYCCSCMSPEEQAAAKADFDIADAKGD